MARVTSDNSNMGKLTASNEDYLEAIYQLGGAEGSVRSVDLATKLDVSKASVNKALSNLKAVGFVQQPHYGDITLTRRGINYARGVQSRHDVLHKFLTAVLGVESAQAAEEACKMEHAISDETLGLWVSFMEKWKSVNPS
ncbi:MAG: metal-dependent transcriptional regulator [Coriobacteriales bacterium]|jgi:Mn-dependent DtxR family transcriptional regulator|nr:metal-dependent transcriptional regulator [Coriobacteriales bacterium]